MKIPFKLTPTSWALRGEMRARAEIEYTLTGIEHDEALLLLDTEPGLMREEGLLDIQYKYSKVTREEYLIQKTQFIKDETERKTAEFEIKHKYGRISENEYEKELATLRGEPWVYVPEVSLDPESPEYGGFHFEWNDAFIEWLQKLDYDAPSDEQIVEAWFNDVCKNVALEQFDGLGDFNDKLNENEENNFGRIDDERFYKK